MKDLIKAISRIFNRKPNEFLEQIDFSDLLADESQRVPVLGELGQGFHPCFSIEEYNKDLLYIFRFHKKDFCMDFSHTDGHFRA